MGKTLVYKYGFESEDGIDKYPSFELRLSEVRKEDTGELLDYLYQISERKPDRANRQVNFDMGSYMSLTDAVKAYMASGVYSNKINAKNARSIALDAASRTSIQLGNMIDKVGVNVDMTAMFEENLKLGSQAVHERFLKTEKAVRAYQEAKRDLIDISGLLPSNGDNEIEK